MLEDFSCSLERKFVKDDETKDYGCGKFTIFIPFAHQFSFKFLRSFPYVWTSIRIKLERLVAIEQIRKLEVIYLNLNYITFWNQLRLVTYEEQKAF